jgi:predicted ATP-dependent serine protease
MLSKDDIRRMIRESSSHSAPKTVAEFKRQQNGQGKKTKVLVIKRASEIEPAPVEWLWPGRLAMGKTTLIGGDPGLGKSQLSAFIVALLSTRGRWPCGEGQAHRKAASFFRLRTAPPTL